MILKDPLFYFFLFFLGVSSLPWLEVWIRMYGVDYSVKFRFFEHMMLQACEVNYTMNQHFTFKIPSKNIYYKVHKKEIRNSFKLSDNQIEVSTLLVQEFSTLPKVKSNLVCCSQHQNSVISVFSKKRIARETTIILMLPVRKQHNLSEQIIFNQIVQSPFSLTTSFNLNLMPSVYSFRGAELAFTICKI